MTQKAPYLFHGADVSYFSGKVRPALPQKSLWYREVVPNLKEIVAKTDVAFIPVLMTPEGEAWPATSSCKPSPPKPRILTINSRTSRRTPRSSPAAC